MPYTRTVFTDWAYYSSIVEQQVTDALTFDYDLDGVSMKQNATYIRRR